MATFIPLINGQAYSYVDITVNINGVIISGITTIEYDETQERTNNYGTGTRPTSRGSGKIEPTCTMSIERGEYNALINASPGHSLLNIPEFDVIVSYTPLNSIPVVDIIKNCRFLKNASGGSEGDTNIISELDLLPSHIEWNVGI